MAYFSMAEGDEPVIGSPSYASTYGDGYEFMFSSAKNLALFEVRVYIGRANRGEGDLFSVPPGRQSVGGFSLLLLLLLLCEARA